MIENILPFLNVISTAAKAMQWFRDVSAKNKGDVRALIEEIKENSRLCFRVVQDKVAPADVIPAFSTAVFDRLNASGFDFDSVRRDTIPGYEGIEKSDLASWAGKPTGKLIENIYDKIKDLRSLHAFKTPENYLWNRRIENIHKRILLLLRHVRT
ncbi:hypothetical protein LPB67_11405 [Undibacterium sp. Jales W-56]|uniref:hypothetical protein n=1 Tax=Undibacterium sp. Jales W-56 TaxID=2897325 RepID=UPI0021D18179|nr:hypothetical protein [Undibacterium sp. Jales W-56]MCU6434379.1 hypothetical protein [Undibacterium sp. Jales W-56]